MRRTVGELVTAYTVALNLRGKGATQTYALAPVARFWANVDVAHVDVAGTTRYIRERKRGDWTNAHARTPAKDGTIRRELGALNAVLAWAHKRGLVDKLVSVDLPRASPPRTVTLAKGPADLFWYKCEKLLGGKHHRAALFAMIALDTGARAASIEGLTWQQIRQRGGGINWSIDFRTPGKVQTAKRQAVVPCSDRLNAALVRVYTTLPGLPEMNEPQAVCGPVSQYAWQQLLQEVRAPDITRHDLRRTFASLAIGRGVDILKVATAMGDNVQTVLKHYAHFAPDYLSGLHEKSPGVSSGA